MTDEAVKNDTAETTQAAAPADPAPQATEQDSKPVHKDTTPSDSTDVSTLPSWAQDRLKQLSSEAADRRVTAKALAEERDALKLTVDQMTVAQNTGLSLDAVRALAGNDVETLTAAAEAVKAAIGTQAPPAPTPVATTQLDGGVVPKTAHTPDPTDGMSPIELARSLPRT